MAVPFRRKSAKKKSEGQGPSKHKFRQRNLTTLIKCNNCQAIKPPHRICSACLTYRSLKY